MLLSLPCSGNRCTAGGGISHHTERRSFEKRLGGGWNGWLESGVELRAWLQLQKLPAHTTARPAAQAKAATASSHFHQFRDTWREAMQSILSWHAPVCKGWKGFEFPNKVSREAKSSQPSE